jgi:hypothetical protein
LLAACRVPASSALETYSYNQTSAKGVAASVALKQQQDLAAKESSLMVQVHTQTLLT